MFRHLPEQASEIAAEVDWLHDWITDLSVFFTVAIVGAMLYFAVKYRKKNGQDHETPRILGSHFLEAVWTIVPTIICIFIAYEGVVIFNKMRKVAPNAVVLNAVGSQWKWDFEYENGKKAFIADGNGEFLLPVNKPVKIVLTSTDVLHSFFLPAMRVKSDAIKGQYTHVSFTPVRTGEYRLFCTEYCGKDHSAMYGMLRVVSEGEFERWVNDKSKKEVSPIQRGKALYVEKACKSCHSLDGTRVVGPTWLKLAGKTGKFSDGTTYTADEQYLRESILNPNKHIVEGFAPNMMPVFEGQLDETDLAALIAFIKSIDGSAPAAPAAAASAAPAVDTSTLSPEERGKLIYTSGKGAAAPCSSCHTLDGSKLVGPTFKGVYGRSGKFVDGTAYTVTDEYLKDSIVRPSAHVVEGYAPAMPPYEGLLSNEDISDVTSFLKTVK